MLKTLYSRTRFAFGIGVTLISNPRITILHSTMFLYASPQSPAEKHNFMLYMVDQLRYSTEIKRSSCRIPVYIL